MSDPQAARETLRPDPLTVMRKYGMDRHASWCVPSRECTCMAQIYTAGGAALRAATPDPAEPGTEAADTSGLREALERLVAAALDYSPQNDHDWRCEYRTAEAGYVAGGPPVIRCECGFDALGLAVRDAQDALAAGATERLCQRCGRPLDTHDPSNEACAMGGGWTYLAAGATERDVERKPDGWHTYHICGGVLREIAWSGPEATCAVCGQWFATRLSPATERPLDPDMDYAQRDAMLEVAFGSPATATPCHGKSDARNLCETHPGGYMMSPTQCGLGLSPTATPEAET